MSVKETPASRSVMQDDAVLRPFHWMKRGAAAVVLTWLFVAAAWWAWDVHERHRLQRAVAAWRLAGGSIDDPAEPPHVADEQNAAVVIELAEGVAAFQQQTSVVGQIANATALPWPPDIRAAAQAEVATNAAAQQLLHRLPTLRVAVWKKLSPAEALAGKEFASLSTVRYLAGLIALDGELALQAKSSSRFFDDALTLEAFRRFFREKQLVIPLLVADGIGAWGYNEVINEAHCLQFDADAKAKARRLIGWYLEASDPMEGAGVARRHEVNLYIDQVNADPDWPATQVGQRTPSWLQWLARPLLVRDAALHLERATAQLATTRPVTVPPAATPGRQRNPSTSNELADGFVQAFSAEEPGDDSFIQAEFQMSAVRRMAATSLACWLYAADHGGRPPGTLGALVPECLPRLPVDPFSPTGAPLGYRRDQGGRPFVYSLFKASADQIAAGTWSPTPLDHLAYSQPHLVAYLDPPAPASPVGAPLRARLFTSRPSPPLRK